MLDNFNQGKLSLPELMSELEAHVGREANSRLPDNTPAPGSTVPHTMMEKMHELVSSESTEAKRRLERVATRSRLNHDKWQALIYEYEGLCQRATHKMRPAFEKVLQCARKQVSCSKGREVVAEPAATKTWSQLYREAIKKGRPTKNKAGKRMNKAELIEELNQPYTVSEMVEATVTALRGRNPDRVWSWCAKYLSNVFKYHDVYPSSSIFWEYMECLRGMLKEKVDHPEVAEIASWLDIKACFRHLALPSGDDSMLSIQESQDGSSYVVENEYWQQGNVIEPLARALKYAYSRSGGIDIFAVYAAVVQDRASGGVFDHTLLGNVPLNAMGRQWATMVNGWQRSIARCLLQNVDGPDAFHIVDARLLSTVTVIMMAHDGDEDIPHGLVKALASPPYNSLNAAVGCAMSRAYFKEYAKAFFRTTRDLPVVSINNDKTNSKQCLDRAANLGDHRAQLMNLIRRFQKECDKRFGEAGRPPVTDFRWNVSPFPELQMEMYDLHLLGCIWASSYMHLPMASWHVCDQLFMAEQRKSCKDRKRLQLQEEDEQEEGNAPKRFKLD